MAKASWLTTSPNSGNGNGAIQNSATIHTGREVRRTTVTVTGVGVSVPAKYSVVQKAKPEFAAFNDGMEMSAPQKGGTVTVRGKSNSASLQFEFVGDAHSVEVPATFRANGLVTNNGTLISGDPGAKEEYDFSLELLLTANSSVSEISRTLKVTAAGGQSAQIAIRQTAGDAFISVSPSEITLNADGSAVSVNVKSNTQWTVE